MGYAIYTSVNLKDLTTYFFVHNSYKIRSWGIPFINRVHDVRIRGTLIEHVPEDMVLVALPKWVARFFLRIGDLTLGLFDPGMFDAKGQPLSSKDIDAMVSPHYEYILFANALRRDQK